MDPRPHLFARIADAAVSASVIAVEGGVITPVEEAIDSLTALGLEIPHAMPSGTEAEAGQEIMRIEGTPLQIALAEERVVGILGKPSGIATATRRFVERSAGDVRIVSGAWKKLPFSQKEMIRSAIVVGGVDPRIAEWPFAYLDKNFVEMLGGPLHTLAAADGLDGYRRIIQVSGTDVERQAVDAAEAGADTVFVDTGRTEDLEAVGRALRDRGLRDQVELAFGGGVTLQDVDRLRRLDVDTLDIGRPIVDAPLIDMRVSVIAVRERSAA